jgi:two-component system chemotaxis response regulator CheB
VTDAAPMPARAIPIVGVAASAGGPAALASLLSGLNGIGAAILIVQHMPADFLDEFVAWMSRACDLPVKLASHQEAVRAAAVLVAPGNSHLKLMPGYRLILDPEPAGPHRPSADVLFESLAAVAGRRAVGVLLTGIGDDGAAGLLAMRRAGATTIAQDAGTAAVDGMPRAARELGAATMILPLPMIAGAIRVALEAAAA